MKSATGAADGGRRCAHRMRPPSTGVTRALKVLRTHQPDRPEVLRQPRLDEVRIREGEVTLQSPFGAPGVADHKPLLRVVVSDRHHSMTADRPLTPARHRRVSGGPDRIGLEALVDGETKDEWIA